jgi:ABC-type molybdate transport system substrate-binding protein
MYPIAVLEESENSDLAAAFSDLGHSNTGQKVLQMAGSQTP